MCCHACSKQRKKEHPMKKIHTLAIALLGFLAAEAQQELGLPFLTHLAQVPVQVNPATITDNRINILLPNAFGGYQNSAFSIGSLFVKTPNGRSLDFESALGTMRPAGNVLRTSASINGGALSFQVKKKFQFSFFQNTHFDLQMSYPKALPELLWRGNGAFVGQEVEIAPKLNMLGYNEYGFGFAARLHEKFSGGINVKYLNGIFGFRTLAAQTTLLTNEEYYQLTFRSDLLFRTGGLTDIFAGDGSDFLAESSPAYFIKNNNNGFAVDIGMNIQATPKLAIHLAMQDVGKIYWTQYALEQKSTGTFQYDGQIVRPFADGQGDFDLAAVRDTLGSIFDFKSKAKPFYIDLPQRFSLVTRYQLDEGLAFGASFHHEYWQGVSSMAIAAHAQKQVGRWLYAGGMLGWHNNASPFLGLNAALQLGPVQLFALTDNVITLLNPELGRGTNFRAGMNLVFLKKKRVKKEVAVPEPSENIYFREGF